MEDKYPIRKEESKLESVLGLGTTFGLYGILQLTGIFQYNLGQSLDELSYFGNHQVANNWIDSPCEQWCVMNVKVANTLGVVSFIAGGLMLGNYMWRKIIERETRMKQNP